MGFHIFPSLLESAAELNPDRRIVGVLLDPIEVKAGGSFPLRPTAAMTFRETGE
jgi:hypothetical protein